MALTFYMRLIANGTAATYRMDDVRFNGRPVNSLRDVNASGRLEFAACRAGQSQRMNVGSFRSMTGITTEMEVVDPRYPGEGLAAAARVLAAVSKIDSVTARVREAVSLNIDKPQNRRVIFIPAEN
jgi:hypothetical protein